MPLTFSAGSVTVFGGVGDIAVYSSDQSFLMKNIPEPGVGLFFTGSILASLVVPVTPFVVPIGVARRSVFCRAGIRYYIPLPGVCALVISDSD